MLPAIQTFADHDIDLPINGDFRGTPSGYSPAPGWTLTADGGQARILPTRDRDDFSLELRASQGRSQSVFSDVHALPGNLLKLELKISGTGYASFGYEVFDETRRTLLGSQTRNVTLTAYDQKIKQYFPMPAGAKFIRIRLTAESGSTARFRDVDADVSITSQPVAVAAPAAPGVIAAPPPAPAAPGVIAAPPPAPAAAPAPASAPKPPCKLLQNDQFYPYRTLAADEHFEISIPVGSDIDFELGENPGRGLYWRVVSYDANICRVTIEHDREGLFSFKGDHAEIELKAVAPGSAAVVLACGSKKVTVHVTAQ